MASTGKDSHRDILNSAVQSFLCQIEKGDQSPDDLPQFVNATLKSLGYDTDVPLPEDIEEFVKEICRSLEYEIGTHVPDALNFVLESCTSKMETGSLSPEDLPQYVNAILLSLGHVTDIPVSEEDPQQLVKPTPRRQEYKLDMSTKVRRKSTGKDKDSTRRIKFFQFVTRVLDKNVSKRSNDMKLLESSGGRRKRSGGGFTIEACFTAATGALLLVPFDHSGTMLIVAIVAIAGGLLGLAYQCSKGSQIGVYFKRVFEGLKEITRKN